MPPVKDADAVLSEALSKMIRDDLDKEIMKQYVDSALSGSVDFTAYYNRNPYTVPHKDEIKEADWKISPVNVVLDDKNPMFRTTVDGEELSPEELEIVLRAVRAYRRLVQAAAVKETG